MEEVSPVKLVLVKFSAACRVTDLREQLPLHVAICQAKDLEQQHPDMIREREHPAEAYKDVELLLHGYPDALQRRDGITKLYPFLQAAEGSNGTLDLAYLLLRRDPTLLRMATD
jgi:hypothetical protein